jgi:hypothetical protein
MSMRSLSVVATLFFVGAVGPALSATLHVPAEYATIQGALNVAVSDDTVLVACGTYYEHGIQMKPCVTIKSETGSADCVTIDGQGLGTVLECRYSELPARLEGITITGGRGAYGGGLWVYYASIEIHRCTFVENEALYQGGGVSAYASYITLDYCNVVANDVWDCRTCNAGGLTLGACTGWMRNCTVAHNGINPRVGGILCKHDTELTIDRSILAFNANANISYTSGCVVTMNCCDVYSGEGMPEDNSFAVGLRSSGNFSEDPLFCAPELLDFRLHRDSPCLPRGVHCQCLVGANAQGCGPVDSVVVTVTTDPSGMPMLVDGTGYTSPADLLWPLFSEHAIGVDSLIGVGNPTRYRFSAWSDSGASSHWTVVPEPPVSYVATLATQHKLENVSVGPGSVSPVTDWFDEGSSVQIVAHPDTGNALIMWLGTGGGSYTGHANPASVTMLGPITQEAHFSPIGYDFTISVSDTNPNANRSTPSGQLRNLYFWLACSEGGLSAFEADVSGSLAPLAFVPLNGVLNAGDPEHLLLAVPGCPIGDKVNLILGYWLVLDTGGDFCLAPSQMSGHIAAVNCGSQGFTLTRDPGVKGYSSTGDAPCRIGVNNCRHPMSQPDPEDPPVPPAPGQAVTRPPQETSLAASQPNPFTGVTRVRFSLAADGPVRVAIYDVAGRLVKRIAEGVYSAGRYNLHWDGRDTRGRSVNAGVYFCRLETQDLSQTRKMVYLGE